MNYPEPQGYLNKEARAIYHEICKHLESVDALEEVDSYGLSMMAFDLWVFHEAAEAVKQNGYKQVTQTGYSQITPDFTAMKECKASFLRYSIKFGLSPSDREKMLKFKGHKKVEDALDEL